MLLIVEVSDATLAFDRGEKAELYAEAQIPEYWVVDLREQRVEVRRDPDDGEYRTLTTLSANDAVAPLFAENTRLPVADFLPTL